MDRAIGSIIMVAAVLLAHILINAVDMMNPRIMLLGLEPIRYIMFRLRKKKRTLKVNTHHPVIALLCQF